MEGSSLASGTTVPSMEAVSQSTTPGFSSQFMHHTSNPSRHPAPIACDDSTDINPYNLTSYVDTPCWVSHADAVASWPPFLVNGEQHQQVYQQYHQQQFIPHQLPQAKEVENDETETPLLPYTFSISSESEASRSSSPVTNTYISPDPSPLEDDITPNDNNNSTNNTTLPTLNNDTIPSKFIQLPQTLTPVDELAHRDGSAGINTSVTNSDISPDTSLKHTSTKYIQLPGSLLSASGL
eukprot:Tbor_TRINITY_DN6078_c0_g1::TRINITY_DN6078_c0_g1_i11::g.10279::m.10279